MMVWLMLLLTLALPTILSLPDGGSGGFNHDRNNNARKLGRRLACNPRDAADTLHFSAEYRHGMFYMKYSIGTPPVAVEGVVDTGSNLVWTMCDPHAKPPYDPGDSGTCGNLPCKSPLCTALPRRWGTCKDSCTYSLKYDDGSYVEGMVLSETLTLGQIRIPDMAIGCSTRTSMLEETGIVGLGRSNLSLIRQLGLNKFSVCFLPSGRPPPRGTSGGSSVFFGSTMDLAVESLEAIRSVPFVNHPKKQPLFYVSLKAISVGKTRVETPFEAKAKADGRGLFAVDTGSDVSTFVLPTYARLKEAFMEEMKVPLVPNANIGVGEGFCVDTDEDASVLPKVVYHLEDKVDLEFASDRFFRHDPQSDLICVKMRGLEGNFSIWGNYQMMGLHMLYDLENNRLSFVSALCQNL